MVTFQTLENISLADITEVFNLAFSDYIVPLKLTEDQLADKIISDNIKLEYSVGAFENKKLVGFILHGYGLVNGKKVVYNAGTGVIPANRGHKLTNRMYDFILPALQLQHIEKVLLEVITENKPAILSYEKAGFKTVRKLSCFKGELKQDEIYNDDYEIRSLENYDWEKLQSFWDWQPTWPNSIMAAENLKRSNTSIGIFLQNVLTGYLVYNSKTKRIQQFAIDKGHRNQGLAKKLFNHIATNYDPNITIINIPADATSSINLMERLGLENYINQFEMELCLNKNEHDGQNKY